MLYISPCAKQTPENDFLVTPVPWLMLPNQAEPTMRILVVIQLFSFLVLQDRVSLCSPGWQQIHKDLSAPVSQVKELKTRVTTT